MFFLGSNYQSSGGVWTSKKPRNQKGYSRRFMTGCILFLAELWDFDFRSLGAKARRKEIHHATDKYTLARFPTKGFVQFN